MGKLFWLVFTCFVLGLASSLYVAYRIEEARWEEKVRAMDQLIKSTKEMGSNTEFWIKILARIDKEKSEDIEKREKDAKEATLEALEESVASWENMPKIERMLRSRTQTNFWSLAPAAVSITFAFFLIAFAIKTKGKLSKDAKDLAVVQGELAGRELFLNDFDRQLQGAVRQDAISLESIRREEKALEKNRQQFWQEQAVSEERQRQAEERGKQVARDRGHALEMLKEAERIEKKTAEQLKRIDAGVVYIRDALADMSVFSDSLDRQELLQTLSAILRGAQSQKPTEIDFVI